MFHSQDMHFSYIFWNCNCNEVSGKIMSHCYSVVRLILQQYSSVCNNWSWMTMMYAEWQKRICKVWVPVLQFGVLSTLLFTQTSSFLLKQLKRSMDCVFCPLNKVICQILVCRVILLQLLSVFHFLSIWSTLRYFL